MAIRDTDGEFLDAEELMGATIETDDPDCNLRDMGVLSRMGMHVVGRGGGGTIRCRFRNARRETPFDEDSLRINLARAGASHSLSACPSLTPGFMVTTSPTERFRTPYKEIVEGSKGF